MNVRVNSTHIGALCGGGVAGILSWLLLQGSVVMSAVVGLVMSFIFFMVLNVAGLLFGRRHRRPLASLLSRDRLRTVIDGGRKKIDTIQQISRQIEDESVRRKVLAVCDRALRILEDIVNEPRDLNAARSFFSWYLDSVIKILDSYTRVQQPETHSSRQQDVNRKVEKGLDLIKQAMGLQLEHLHENNLLDLDTEIALLEKTLRMDSSGR